MKRFCEAFTHDDTHDWRCLHAEGVQDPAETSTPWLPFPVPSCCGGGSCAASSCSARAVPCLCVLAIGCTGRWRVVSMHGLHVGCKGRYTLNRILYLSWNSDSFRFLSSSCLTSRSTTCGVQGTATHAFAWAQLLKSQPALAVQCSCQIGLQH